MPKHEAFFDLENSLVSRLNSAWSKQWVAVSREIDKAIATDSWQLAHTLVDQLDFAPVADQQATYLETIGMSAMLLGASRISKPKNSVVYKSPPKDKLANAVKQCQIMLSRNATLALREEAHLMLHSMEYGIQKGEHLQKSEVRVQIRASTDAYFGLMSSLHVSRLSSFGFLAEAMENRIERYRISSLLDDRTCKLCAEVMDGQIFPVSAGVAQAEAIMQSDDPDSLRIVAPWPRQTKSNLEKLAGASVQELIDAGLQLPPYHPVCRCIAVEVDDNSTVARSINIQTKMNLGLLYGDEIQDFATAPTDERVAVASRALYGPTFQPTQGALLSRLLGDRSDIAETAQNFSLLSGIGVGFLLGLRDVGEAYEKPSADSYLEQALLQ